MKRPHSGPPKKLAVLDFLLANAMSRLQLSRPLGAESLCVQSCVEAILANEVTTVNDRKCSVRSTFRDTCGVCGYE